VRFRENGPAIPDELLVARDAGQVLFFCGAGVSIANARLPSFLELAHKVLEELKALPDSPARRMTEIAKDLQNRTIPGVGGIVAADRIFGLLEREFDLNDIEGAVGCALRPQIDANLDAHRTLLALSEGPAGGCRLVTTNFDLLFEAAHPRLRQWAPNDLPDLRRHASFEGIVHLHGMLDSNYQRAMGGRLVLSSAEFGRAYLAESWATEFIRAAIDRYRIVFIGYTADDPPVQYLHSEVLRNVGFALGDSGSDLKPLARRVWRYLLEAKSWRGRENSTSSFEINTRIRKEGWTPGLCCKDDRRRWEDGDKLDPISFMRRYRKER
jgi:hypothetical protein